MGPRACARQLEHIPSVIAALEDVQDQPLVELLAPGANLITDY